MVAVPVVETNFPAGITTLLEAMSMGKAVVVAETSGLAGIVDHGRTGLVVPPGDVAAMRAALESLLGSESLRRDLGEQAHARALERHSLDVYCDALARHLFEAGGRPYAVPSP